MDQNQETTSTESTPPVPPSLGTLERLMTWLYDIRLWFTTAARVGQLMARGGYLIGERRRLFVKLGEIVYEKNQRGSDESPTPAEDGQPSGQKSEIAGEISDDTAEVIRQIDRLTKKLEIEEMLIRSARFGVKQRAAGEPSKSEET